MKRINRVSAVVLLLLLSACSADDKEEKSKIEAMNDRVAQQAIERIKQPLELAEKAKRLTEEHNQQIEEGVE